MSAALTLPAVRPLDAAAAQAAAQRQAQLIKPPGALGRLEELAVWMAGVAATPRPDPRARIVVAAADHGVSAQGISAYPQAVTAQMLAAFDAGHAAIAVLAGHTQADLVVVDAGVIDPPPVRAVPAGLPAPSADLSREPALTPEQLERALELGRSLAAQAADDGVHLLLGGEMGIGNTTPAACVAAALTGASPAAVAGRGTGLDDAGLERKQAVIARALAVHADALGAPLEVLRRLGGGELGVLCGLALGAGEHGLGYLCDGVIATAAVAVAVALQPDLRSRLLAAHRSTEPAHGLLLEWLGLEPLLDLGLRLGEGTGAAAALLLVAAACRLHDGMATFAEAGVG